MRYADLDALGRTQKRHICHYLSQIPTFECVRHSNVSDIPMGWTLKSIIGQTVYYKNLHTVCGCQGQNHLSPIGVVAILYELQTPEWTRKQN